jgi:hypothetical protein
VLDAIGSSRLDLFAAAVERSACEDGMPDWIQHFDVQVATSLAALTAVCTAVGRVIWAVSSFIVRWIGYWLSTKVKQVPLHLGPYPNANEIVSARCLIIRYGSDDYLTELASPQDQWIGRLRNRALTMASKVDGRTHQLSASVMIPVHRRLGTQFKCFVDFKTEAGAIHFAKNSELIWTNSEPAGETFGPHRAGTRVWFLVPGIPSTRVGGSAGSGQIRNNILLPF